jgi:hypothetical protein
MIHYIIDLVAAEKNAAPILAHRLCDELTIPNTWARDSRFDPHASNPTHAKFSA